MENDVNLREIRRRLPHGSLAVIAKELNINPKKVYEVINSGRSSAGCRDAVLSMAIDIIDGKKKGSENLIAKAEKSGLATDGTFTMPYQKKKKPPQKRGKLNIKLIGLIGIGAVLLIYGKKILAKIQQS